MSERILKGTAVWKWPLILVTLVLLGATLCVPVLASIDLANPLQHAAGTTAVVLFLTLALATLITEDLTCIWAGVMVAEGRISFAFAAIACLAGIFVGDILLFLAGRLLGRTALHRAPLRWFVSASEVERSSAWFRRRGMAAIALSRFLPGTRLPTYVAAGLLDTSFLKFTFYFLIAAVIWTPMLVGASMLLGGEVIESALMTQQSWLLRLTIPAVCLFLLVKLLLRLASFRGRRLLLGRWRRLTRWEFWPPWIFYPPVTIYVAYLGLRHRSLTLFTCANPAIEAGGFIGESKTEILRGLATAPESRHLIAPWKLLPCSLGHGQRLALAREFMRDQTSDFPVVLKPDAGERGAGVVIIRSETELDDYLSASPGREVIIQQYIGGQEFGVFYSRYPGSDRGQIFSITKKLFPSVVGDGASSLENLILKDARAVCMARTYFKTHSDRLLNVPAGGEPVQLIEIGTHCRGSIFLDGSEIKTPALEDAIDGLAKGFEGFYFGRFDIRTPSLADFQHGRNFSVVELNGVTSEATHIYDPKNSLPTAYRVLFNQWRIAFDIGAQNRRRGVQPASLRQLLRSLVKQFQEKVKGLAEIPTHNYEGRFKIGY